MLRGTISPIPKTKNISANVSEYRPVMQSSYLLKIFEVHVLEFLSEKIGLNCRQFGFRKGSSITDACLILKDLMKKYSTCKKSAYAIFIDLTKAFDNVDHSILGKKLLKSNIPIDLVLIILRYLRNQQANIRWKGSLSIYYIIEKGVRQGGILSPFLFNFYINSIIEEISDMDVGCNYGFTRCNIIAYADDLVLLAPSIMDTECFYLKLQYVKLYIYLN